MTHLKSVSVLAGAVLREIFYLQGRKELHTAEKSTLFNFHAERCVSLIVTSVGCLAFTVQNDVFPEFDTRKGCFHIHLQKGESVSLLTLNLSLRCAHILDHFKTYVHILVFWSKMK